LKGSAGIKPSKSTSAFIAASNRDLQEAVKERRVSRRSLLPTECGQYQIASFEGTKGGSSFLVNFFIDKFNQKYKMKVKGLSQRAMNLLMD